MFDISPGRHITSADGTKIWAESAGDPAKPAVVFIHGFAYTGLVFEKQFADERLLRDLHLVRYDVRGQGRSGMPETAESYESIRHAQDFRAVCETFRVKKPIVAGWSVGCIIPVDITSAYGASYIAGIIYIGGLPWRSAQPAVATPFNLSLLPRLCSLDVNESREAIVEFADSCLADPASVPFAEMAAWVGGMAMQPCSVRLFSGQRTQDERKFLEEGAKTLPVLVVQGTEDRHIQCTKSIKLFRATFRDVEVREMEGVGHSPFYERPEQFGAMVLNFVNKVRVRREGH